LRTTDTGPATFPARPAKGGKLARFATAGAGGGSGSGGRVNLVWVCLLSRPGLHCLLPLEPLVLGHARGVGLSLAVLFEEAGHLGLGQFGRGRGRGVLEDLGSATGSGGGGGGGGRNLYCLARAGGGGGGLAHGLFARTAGFKVGGELVLDVGGGGGGSGGGSGGG
jgi:hypothetical protein